MHRQYSGNVLTVKEAYKSKITTFHKLINVQGYSHLFQVAGLHSSTVFLTSSDTYPRLFCKQECQKHKYLTAVTFTDSHGVIVPQMMKFFVQTQKYLAMWHKIIILRSTNQDHKWKTLTTTVGLHRHNYHRLQWSIGSVPDCGAQNPEIKS